MGKRGPLPRNKLASAIAVDVPTPSMSKESAERERRWKAEDALRTITKAEECKADRGLMKDVKALAKEQMNNLKKV